MAEPLDYAHHKHGVTPERWSQICAEHRKRAWWRVHEAILEVIVFNGLAFCFVGAAIFSRELVSEIWAHRFLATMLVLQSRFGLVSVACHMTIPIIPPDPELKHDTEVPTPGIAILALGTHVAAVVVSYVVAIHYFGENPFF